MIPQNHSPQPFTIPVSPVPFRMPRDEVPIGRIDESRSLVFHSMARKPRPRRHTFFFDGLRRVVEPTHPRRNSERGIVELNERLRASQVVLRFRSMAKAVAPAARRRQ